MDDILVTATSVVKVDQLFTDMQVVDLKNLGVVSKFLEVSVNYDDKSGWTMDQEKVIEDMLVKFQLDKMAPVRTPIGYDHDGEGIGALLPSGGTGRPGRPTVQTFQS
ncbi:Pol Polyprotein [Phytophthora megakarya]|uniref:Pol Polyprotein n=1 Tax=Phytophthora megakarya TaxID=4795 RepID=A0A225W337_9STRA|nr:Pol Polyprotein [Phytophthora megakarya]